MRHPILALAALLLGSAPGPAPAAESYDNCAQFITSLPAVLSTQGTWCMDKDLSTALTSGSAITVGANNVTIDCNHFKLGGLAGGTGTLAVGIELNNFLNLTVRNCAIRGFRRGILALGTATGGHLIENNRFDANREAAIFLTGTGNTVRGNLVYDTGAGAGNGAAFGIYFAGDGAVIDNTVDGLLPAAGMTSGNHGIAVVGSSAAVVRGNRVLNVDAGTTGGAYGIAVYAGQFATVTDNDVVQGTGDASTSAGIYCASDMILTGNRVYGYTNGLSACTDDGGNVVEN